MANKERKVRADKGVIRIQERDLIMLSWMAEQHAIRLDHMQILAGRLSKHIGESAKLGYKTTHNLINRLNKAGLVEHKIILFGQPLWVWPTKLGLDHVESAYKYKPPSVGKLGHMFAVNSVRLWFEGRLLETGRLPYQHGGWISERDVNGERKLRGKRHIVDGEAILNGQPVAIEVELRLKSLARFKSILWELKEDYGDVWYFTPPHMVEDLNKVIKDVDPYDEVFSIYPLVGDNFEVANRVV